MDLELIAQAYDTFQTCIALNSSDRIVCASLSQDSHDSTRFMLSVYIKKRMLSEAAPAIEPNNMADMIGSLKHRQIEAWDLTDAEAALAICSAIKSFTESSEDKQKDWHESYRLGHVIKMTETDNSNGSVAFQYNVVKSYADPVNKKFPIDTRREIYRAVEDFESSKDNYAKSAQMNICRRIISAAVTNDLEIDRNWVKNYISPKAAQLYNAVTKAKASGWSRREIKKSMIRVLNGTDLDMF